MQSLRKRLYWPAPLKAARECLKFGTTDDRICLVSLRLDIDSIKTKSVFFYHSIDPAVTGTPKRAPGVFPPAPVAHFHQQIDNEPLEKGWLHLPDLVKDFAAQSCQEPGEVRFD
jgi:hypothetical protein